MSFDVKCPECGKVYGAEVRMAGKRIRCRQCSNVFTVELPDEVPVAVGAVSASGPALQRAAGSSSKTAVGTRVGQPGATAVAAPPRGAPARPAPIVFEKASSRPSVPQDFPMSEVWEAWLPLVLGVICGIWIPAETFADNKTGLGWVPVVRIAVFAFAFLGIVVPLTLWAVGRDFRNLKKDLPPSPFQRIATTFSLPATLAYVFWLISGGVGSFVAGCVLGLALVVFVFWLLFRLGPQEAAHSFAVAAGAFVGSTILAALVLIGASSAINHMMLSSRYSGPLRESPLGANFAWIETTPAPAPKAEPAAAPTLIVRTTPGTGVPRIPADGSPSLVAPPSVAAPVIPPTSTTLISPVTAPLKMEDPDGDPALRSELFGGTKADSDPFVVGIQDSKLPWVKWVFRPSDQGVFEQEISPMTASPFTGLVRMSGISGKQLECCRLSPAYRPQGSIALDDSGDGAFAGRYALSPDGTALLRLVNGDSPKVEIAPFRGAVNLMPLTPPDPSRRTTSGPFMPELLGAISGQRMLVRWSRPEETVLQVYDWQSRSGTPVSTVRLGQSDTPGTYAISPDGNSFAVVEQAAEQSFLTLYGLSGAAGQEPALLPTGKVGDKVRRSCTGIAFSPDGQKVAILLEHGSEGVVRSWAIAGGRRTAEGSCKVPSPDAMVGQIRGRAFDWLTNHDWLVRGQTVIDANTGSVVGILTSEIVAGQQMADDQTAYLSYLATDGHQHVAVVRFNPSRLTAAPVAGAGETASH